MAQIICMLAPAAVALQLYEKKSGALELRNSVMIYLIFVGLINMISMGIVAVIFHHPEYIVTGTLFSVSFTIRYLITGFVIALVLPAALRFIYQCLTLLHKNFEFKLIVERRNSLVKDEEQEEAKVHEMQV